MILSSASIASDWNLPRFPLLSECLPCAVFKVRARLPLVLRTSRSYAGRCPSEPAAASRMLRILPRVLGCPSSFGRVAATRAGVLRNRQPLVGCFASSLACPAFRPGPEFSLSRTLKTIQKYESQSVYQLVLRLPPLPLQLPAMLSGNSSPDIDLRI